MIVKNEEKFLPDCLKSVQGVVDEIILVDTGSTDSTIDIAKQFGAKVITHQWNNNFAEARNISLKHAKGEWILILDADESLDLSDRKHIHTYIEKPEVDIFSLELINYYGEERDEHKVYTMTQSRLFRSNLGLSFENSIHETINLNKTNVEIQSIPHLPIRIHHIGYLKPVTEEKKKNERNMNLLHEEIKKEGHSSWMEYHLAGEYYRQEKFDIALQYCNESILRFIFSGLKPPSLVYNLKYSTLISSGSFKEALKGIDKAIQLYPDYVDLHFYKAMSLYYEEMYDESILTLKHCLSLGDKNPSYLTMSGTGTYQALYFQALCFKKLDNHAKCRELLNQAIHIYPNYEEAITELQAIEK
jgi:glycosyltransferase involved in cell wall biosynthesis